MASKERYAEKGVVLNVGGLIVDADLAKKTIITFKGIQANYDILIFASGSEAFVPSILGVRKKGFLVYRTIEDLDRIKTYIPKAT
jgi:nitrite reductase (NADH) large subunit